MQRLSISVATGWATMAIESILDDRGGAQPTLLTGQTHR
jgi:hypothetical protein